MVMKVAKTLLIVLLALIIAACLSACTKKDEASSDVTGEWAATVSGYEFEAVVVDETIEIYLTFDGGRGLYWSGTFPESIEKDSSAISTGDTALMDASLYGSQDDTKMFTYDGDIEFPFSILGVGRTIELKRA